MNKEEYQRRLEELRNTQGVTEEDIQQFQKSAIIMKSVEHIKMRA